MTIHILTIHNMVSVYLHTVQMSRNPHSENKQTNKTAIRLQKSSTKCQTLRFMLSIMIGKKPKKYPYFTHHQCERLLVKALHKGNNLIIDERRAGYFPSHKSNKESRRAFL